MAATATQQILHNGPRNLVVHYTIAGSTGDTTAGTLLDISSIDSTIPADGLRLERTEYSIVGFNMKLSWDATADVDFVEFAIGEGTHNYGRYGGIPNNAGAGVTGDVNFTTNAYTGSGDRAHFTLWFKKKRGVL